MWKQGRIGWRYKYSIKVFDTPSSMGINKGRISKLDLMKNGKIVAHYDRGWDQKPTTAADKKALDAILRKYPA